jgi:hypothetical protein
MTFVLLSSSYVAQAAPRIDSRALDARALPVRDGDPPPLPAPKDDDLPQGDGKDLLPWSDDDYVGEDYKDFPDYEKNQDQTSATKKRAIGPLPGGGLPNTKGDPMNPNQGGTKWLRSVGINGKWKIPFYSRLAEDGKVEPAKIEIQVEEEPAANITQPRRLQRLYRQYLSRQT